MYIRSENPAHTPGAIKTPDMDEPARFNAEGVARVTAEVGEHLAKTYDTITIESREDTTESTDDEHDDADGETDGTADADADTNTDE